jgi:hypothetical protein
MKIKKFNQINEGKKKIYKKTIKVEILSDYPFDENFEEMSLSDIDYEITEGMWSGQIEEIDTTELEGHEAVNAIQNQGSSPDFFGMDEEGNELD